MPRETKIIGPTRRKKRDSVANPGTAAIALLQADRDLIRVVRALLRLKALMKATALSGFDAAFQVLIDRLSGIGETNALVAQSILAICSEEQILDVELAEALREV
jgi:hypothetical protein